MEPVVSLEAKSIPGTPEELYRVFSAPAEQLCRLVHVPVGTLSVECPTFHEKLVEGFPRDLTGLPSLGAGSFNGWYSPVALMDLYDLWKTAPGRLEVHGPAFVLDGAVRLLEAVRAQPLSPVPVVVRLNGSWKDLLTARQSLSRRPVRRERGHSLVLDRLLIGEEPRTLTIVKGLRVVPTARGYTAALRVRCDGDRYDKLFMCGAASLSRALEAVRKRHGTLEGVRLRIHKQSNDRWAPYVVFEVDEQ